VSILASVLFYNSYRRAGLLKEAGRGISASETSDALAAINSFIDFIGGMRGTVFAEDRQLFNLVSGQQVYMIGLDPAADWQAPMPFDVTKAGYCFTTTNPPVEQPFDIMTPQEWAALSPKTLQSTNPYKLLFQRNTVPSLASGTYGVVSDMGAVTLWPIPLDATIQVALYLFLQIQQVPSAVSVLVLPNTVQEMLETNLAVRLAAMFPKRAAISPLTLQIAKESLARFKAMNAQPLEMRVEAGALGVTDQNGSSFNLFSNSYNNSNR
jgi:hypothetical protein